MRYEVCSYHCSLSAFYLDDELVTALPSTVLSDEHIDILLSLPRQEQSTDLWSTLWQFQFLQQFSLMVQEGQTAVLG
jgi:hypothetical protein